MTQQIFWWPLWLIVRPVQKISESWLAGNIDDKKQSQVQILFPLFYRSGPCQGTFSYVWVCVCVCVCVCRGGGVCETLALEHYDCVEGENFQVHRMMIFDIRTRFSLTNVFKIISNSERFIMIYAMYKIEDFNEYIDLCVISF